MKSAHLPLLECDYCILLFWNAGLTEVDELPCPSSALPVLAPPEETLPLTRVESLISAGVEEETLCDAQEMETELNEELSSQGDPEVDDARGPEPNPMSGSSLPKSESDPNFDPEDEAQGESLFPCPHCERHFTTKQGLERHTHIHVSANLHTHTFKCRYCGKLFGSQAGRRRHERRHESGLKKRPGSLAGTAFSLSPSLKTDSSSSNLTATDGSILVVDSHSTSGVTPELSGEGKKGEGLAVVEQAHLLDENGESKELHICKYCRKAFSSHTNMRRHQRRIHERHLLPKGIRRKGSLLQEVLPVPQQSAATPHGSLGAIPQLVYQPSREAEDEGDREEEYMVDISSNISENLSLYIDGKILSTGAVSGCEVIEVDAGSAALLGLNTVIISQALKVETASNVRREAPSTTSQTLKRRTSTPPLLPKIKTESESSSSSASSSSSLSSSSSSSSLAGTVVAPAVDDLAFPKEKTVYLSPKLKQLLQNQEGHRLTPPAPRLSVSPLSSGSGRFKRRTASPPHSPPQTDLTSKGQSSEAGAPFALKVPKLESVRSPAWSREERDPGSSPRADWMGSLTGGSPCNQQPLDLSGVPGKNSDGTDQGEAVLDLSMHCKSLDEIQSKAGPAPQPLSKKRKPNTSILEKVLMKEYSGLELAEEEVADDQVGPVAQPAENAIANPSPDIAPSLPEELGAKSTVPSTSPHPPPPSLTPVPLNPPSPCTASLVSTTPSPPILPTVSSPLLCQSPECGHVPVLSSKPSKLMQVGQEENVPSAETGSVTVSSERLPDEDSSNLDPTEDSKDQGHFTQPVISLTNPKISTVEPCIDSESVCVPPAGPSRLLGDTKMSPLIDLGAEGFSEPSVSTQKPVDCSVASKSDSNLDLNQEHKAEEQPQSPSPHPPVLEASDPEPTSHFDPSASSERLPQLVAPPPLISPVIKEESDHKEEPANSPSDAPKKPAEPETFCKSFVCNVCEEPFCSMKELRCHIVAHALDWPFKCEFCVQLFGNGDALLEHRSTLHGVGRIYVCSTCCKEFAFFCNLQQHQLDLHPGQSCTHTVLENGKLRPQNFTDPIKASTEPLLSTSDSKLSADCDDKGDVVIQREEHENDGDEEEEMDDPTEELYTTIKIMASEGGKQKGPDVRLGINQHYPSFKPPPFPYHNRTSTSSVESATNFTTHNIPQTFSTAIRCTKCGKSFDNMPELHKHILSCANASDKRRYTPKKNPIPLRQAVKPLNGTLSPAATATVGHVTLHRMGQPKRLEFGPEPTGKTKLSALSKKDQRGLSQQNKSTTSSQSEEEQGSHVCAHCQREFTYRGSLNKHMTVSCPKKPASSGLKIHGADDSITQERNRNLRSARRNADSEMQKEVSDLGSRTVGKSRAVSSGVAEGATSVPVKPQPSRGKPTASQAQLKSPSSSSSSSPAASIPQGKKSRGLPAPQQSPPQSPPAQRPPGRMQRGTKEVLQKKVSEVTSPLPLSKKEERFAVKARDRVDGPVTRSLQLASVMTSGETMDPPNPEPQETQVMKNTNEILSANVTM